MRRKALVLGGTLVLLLLMVILFTSLGHSIVNYLYGIDLAEYGIYLLVTAFLGGVMMIFALSSALSKGKGVARIRRGFMITFHGIPWSYLGFMIATIVFMGWNINTLSVVGGVATTSVTVVIILFVTLIIGKRLKRRRG